MPITSVASDAEALTFTIVGEYPVPVERLWAAWSDPRQLEKFWGPETWPATFTRHDMVAGGHSHYYMTGPDGERAPNCLWEFTRVEPMRRIEVINGFAREDFTFDPEWEPMKVTFSFESTPTGSRLTSATRFESLESMEKLVGMGMIEGTKSAMGKMDAVLADLASFAANLSAEAEILSDTQVRICRVIRGSVDQVWRAHNDPELMKRWLLGPDGWQMPVCEVAGKAGDSYRYEWETVSGENRFGFEGELLEVEAPHRSVTSERMIGMDGPGTTNEMTLTALPDGTLLTIVITYPNAEMRDMILGTGMTGGMEESYQRLEREVLAAA